MPTIFKCALGQRVVLSESLERGVIIARAEYLTDEPWYLVRYRDATGCQREIWWRQSALMADEAKCDAELLYRAPGQPDCNGTVGMERCEPLNETERGLCD